jgi:hypothetical protein
MGSALANGIILGENGTLSPYPNMFWVNMPSDVGTGWKGVLFITVAGVVVWLPALCCKFLRDVASLVGGGVCICEKSILTGPDRGPRPSWLSPTFLSEFGSGDDDSLR